MKIRSDFVSNSSSCSFNITDIKKGVEELISLGEIPYQINNDLEIRIIFKNKNAYEILSTLYGEKDDPMERCYMDWGGKLRKPDPEDTQSKEIYFYGLEDLLNTHSQLLNKIESIQIYLNDGHNDFERSVIKMLYDVLKLKGINVDTENSELSINDDTDNTFITNLVNQLIKLKSKKGSKNGA